MSVGVQVVNPYLEEYERLVPDWHAPIHRRDYNACFDPIMQRDNYVHRYAWAIPTTEALQAIAKHAPIIEVGAGTGYWAHLLKQMGVDILATDYAPPPHNFYHSGSDCHCRVVQADEKCSAKYPQRTLFLCWPPYDDLTAAKALECYRGEHVIYIGEGQGGCTADDTFHEHLADDWDEIATITLPQWPGLHDYMSINRRKPVALRGKRKINLEEPVPPWLKPPVDSGELRQSIGVEP